jgi:hypothetical protein
VISPSQGRYLAQTQNKHKQASTPRVGFEPTIPEFERAKTVHALDRATTVIRQQRLCFNPGYDEIITRFYILQRLVEIFRVEFQHYL